MSLARHEGALRRILLEIAPYLDDVVVIGGWVPHLYQRYGGFTNWGARITLTGEVDLLVDRRIVPAGRLPLSEILRRAGFEPVESHGGFAVWERDIQAGESIEFLVAHQGTSLGEGNVVPIEDQKGLGAISLEGLELLQRFKRQLTIPVLTTEGETLLDVWVPTLGAYVVNKASTYARRHERVAGGNPKRAKDLLYLRDLMAAGAEVVAKIEEDLCEIVDEDHRFRQRVCHARNTLYLSIGGAYQSLLPEVARMLVEREPSLDSEAAEADVRGHLTDLVEILEEISD